MRLPRMTVGYWRGVLADLVARLIALPPRALAGLGAAILVLCGALWWLYRSGLRWMALLNRQASPACRWKRCVGVCPCSLPVAIWMVVAWTVGVAERPAWLLAGALGLWPMAGFLLHLSALLFAGASEHGATRRRLHALARWAVLAAVAAAALGLVIRAFPCCRRSPISSTGRGSAVCS